MSQTETIPVSPGWNKIQSGSGSAAKPSPAKGELSEWNNFTRILFRFFFIYFIIQVIPLDWKFYREVFSINWLNPHVFDLLQLSKYSPDFFPESVVDKNGLAGYANWGLIVIIASIGALVWTYYDRNKTKEYNGLYYWLRAILRYRLAIGVIAYGFIKLFPLQIPYPSLSSLHTNYGDFVAWKIYYQTIGIVPWYESFLGAVEIFAGSLLCFRRTATLGAGIIVGFAVNVMAANFAYDMGGQVYSSFLLVIAVFLLAYDAPRLYSLLIAQRFTIADRFTPSFTKPWLQKAVLALKGAFVVFILLFAFKAYSNYKHDPYLIPKTDGLSGSYGYYNVKEFKLNSRSIPYSTTDTGRWQNVVFEKWATLSVKIAGPLTLDSSNGNNQHQADKDRNYESSGVGGRRYYNYNADTINHTILLENKNPTYKDDKLLLHYNRPDSSTIILTGFNVKKEAIYIELNKVVKKYMLFEGRRKPLKL